MADVDGLISDAKGYAAEVNSQAVSMVSRAVSMISGLGNSVSISEPVFSDSPTVTVETDVPEFQAPTFDLPEVPAAPDDYANLPCLEPGSAPVFSVGRPSLTLPSTPSELAVPDIRPPSVSTDLAFPDVPGELLSVSVVAPSLAEREMPDAPALQIPVFDAAAPDGAMPQPDDYVRTFESAYRNMAPSMAAAIDGQIDALMKKINPQYEDQVARLEARLDLLMQGGSGLSADDEDAIYERSKARNDAEYRRVRQAAWTDAARRGFTLPDSALAGAVLQARQAASDNNARAALDIAIRQAEREQDNIRFAVSMSVQMRTAVLTAAVGYCQSLVAINSMALDYAKSVLDASVQIYDTLARSYGMRLDAWKAEAAVYESRLRGVLALVEMYQAEIGAQESLARVDMAKVELFKGRIEGLQMLAGVYRTQVDAVLGKATVEKMKVEVFGEQVRAYAAQAEAKNAEWQGYAAAVGGQESLIRAYATEAQAYSAEVEGYRATIQARQAEIESITSYNKGVTDQYVAAVEGYRAVAGANAQVAASRIDFQKSQLMAVQARLGAEEANARLAQEYYRTAAQLNQDAFRTSLSALIENAKLNAQKAEAAAKVSLSGADVYRGLASSAMAGINTLVTKSNS